MTRTRKKLLVLLWLLAPVGMIVFHYGPGQRLLGRDKAAREVSRAERAARKGDWDGAVAAYERALAVMPASDSAGRTRVALARADARIWKGDLPEALGELEGMMDTAGTNTAAPELARMIRAELAEAQYYTAWLMRLEGASSEEWLPETENARQQFRYVAEDAFSTNLTAMPSLYQTNLEATARLAMMDMTELQGMPLPGKIKNGQGKDVSQSMRKQRASRDAKKGKGKKPGEEPPKEPEKDDSRKAGTGQRPDETGS